MLEISPLVWGTTIGLVVLLLAVDLVLAAVKPHEVGFREATAWSVFYIAVAIGFGVWFTVTYGGDFGTQYFTGYLVEKSLSVDNLFVFVIIMTTFAVPARHQHMVLTFGIVFLVVGLGMVPKVQGTVDQRDQGIAADLAAAEAARGQADAAEAAWRARENASREAAQKLLAEARAKGAAAAAERLAAANADMQARVAQAEADIAAQRGAAMAQVEQVAAEAAQAIVERVSGVRVSEQDAQGAVKAVLHG